ncbi:uncharacterized protein V6R79_000466 [Siganus canaliculatus]
MTATAANINCDKTLAATSRWFHRRKRRRRRSQTLPPNRTRGFRGNDGVKHETSRDVLKVKASVQSRAFSCSSTGRSRSLEERVEQRGEPGNEQNRSVFSSGVRRTLEPSGNVSRTVPRWFLDGSSVVPWFLGWFLDGSSMVPQFLSSKRLKAFAPRLVLKRLIWRSNNNLPRGRRSSPSRRVAAAAAAIAPPPTPPHSPPPPPSSSSRCHGTKCKQPLVLHASLRPLTGP